MKKTSIKIIDDNICSKFKPFRPPENKNKIRKITTIREIGGLVDDIRELRYGPTLQIGDDYVTTEFKSSCFEQGVRYSEQLYINVRGCSSYKEMFTGLSNLIDARESDSSGVIRMDEVERELQNKRVDIIKRFDKYKEEYKKNHISAVAEHLRVKARDMSDKASGATCVIPWAQIKASLWEVFAKEAFGKRSILIENEISNILEIRGSLLDAECQKSKRPKGSNEDKDKLKNRIVSIWLVAECFRYPPMLFYSLITLHNLLNGYISIKEVEDRLKSIEAHPAAADGAQRTLLLCFESQDNNAIPTTNKEREKIIDFETKKFECLKTMYLNICKKNELDCGAEVSKSLTKYFNRCVKYYLHLCNNATAINLGDNLTKDLENQLKAEKQNKKSLSINAR